MPWTTRHTICCDAPLAAAQWSPSGHIHRRELAWGSVIVRQVAPLLYDRGPIGNNPGRAWRGNGYHRAGLARDPPGLVHHNVDEIAGLRAVDPTEQRGKRRGGDALLTTMQQATDPRRWPAPIVKQAHVLPWSSHYALADVQTSNPLPMGYWLT